MAVVVGDQVYVAGNCGPQIKRLEFFLVIMMKSIRAGL